jgi:hypothetical protein
MIDPKLNETNDKVTRGRRELTDTAETDTETNATTAKPRPGLSINDTVASNANLSVGARGTDTSGVRSGAGAGAGGVQVTAANHGESPAPQVVSGARGSGTTPLGSVPAGQSNTTTKSGAESEAPEWTNEEVSHRAYQNWHARGCPHGSPEEDWHKAERELRERRLGKASTASA